MDDRRRCTHRIMDALLQIFLVFVKIGSVSFGGGYAMLPFIEQEVIVTNGWLTPLEFLDVLAISQITPGPIAINSATFIGFKHLGFLGGLFATTGIVLGPFIFMSIVSRFMEKYKSSSLMKNILSYIKPITVALILSTTYSTFLKSVIDFKSFLIFIASAILLQYTKIHPIAIILLFGIIGIILNII